MAAQTLPAPERAPAESDDATHLVHGCQVDATPRLALCGADCSGQAEGFTSAVCVVCVDLMRPVLLVGRCERCGAA